ncbi:unnamed protein product, partial [Symbiodinium sp. CCMP2592]
SSSSQSSSSAEEPSSSASQAHMEDAASLYGLNKKNLVKPPDATVLDDLGARQLAYTVSFVTSSMVASDAFEIGGELVTCIDTESLLRDREMTMKKQKAKASQTDAKFEASSLLPDRKYTGGKRAWTDALESKLKLFREEAKGDLKKMLGTNKKKRTPEAPPAKVPPEPKKKKEEEEEEDEEDKEEASPGDVPLLPDSDDFSEPEGEPKESDDDDDGDNDVFRGKFAASKTGHSLEELLSSLPARLVAAKDEFEDAVLKSLPSDLSMSFVCTPCNCSVRAFKTKHLIAEARFLELVSGAAQGEALEARGF